MTGSAGEAPATAGVRRRGRAARRIRTFAASVFIGVLGAIGGAASATAQAPAVPSLIPAPASMELARGEAFRITADTTIVVGSAGRRSTAPVAEDLAEILRASTGYRLPVVSQRSASGEDTISLDLSEYGFGDEGYRLRVTEESVRIRAATAAGLSHGVQTLRQLLPAAVESAQTRPGPWTVPAVRIFDEPRFAYRGAMLDVSRHFFGVADVKRYIDLISQYKINTLHLHLSDDQGWRIMIERWPRLTTYGGSLEVGGTPGGFYTKADFEEIVAYAAEHFITIVPEIDMPGHTNAALASYPELNCDEVAPPLYTGIEVGFSSLCIDKEITYEFLEDVIGEIAAMSPGPVYHLGGDEAQSTSDEDYVRFIDRQARIVSQHGKRVMGWQEIINTNVPRGSIAQYWIPPRPGSASGEFVRVAAEKGLKLVMSPANKAYLDMQYNPTSPYGLRWAGYVEVRDSYDWDPATFVPGVREEDLLGVEAPLWSETLLDFEAIEFMAFPRLPGIAEIGWSPAEGRSWSEYRFRLAAQGPRWDALGVEFYRSPQVPWPASGEGR